MKPTSKTNFFQNLTDKKRDFPALVITSNDSHVVYSHYGTGPNYKEVFNEFVSFHDQNLGTSLLASLSDNDRTVLQNWLDILCDETYVELMMPEDIVKLCPSFSLTWHDGQNYEVRFEAIKTEVIYEYVLVWLEPHGQTQQQQLASEIIELMKELRTAPREVINNLREYLPEVGEQLNLSNYAEVEDSEELLNQLSRHLHAAKGTTFFLGFTTIGNAFHDAESKFEEIRGTWQLSDGLQPIRNIFSQLYLLINLAEGISTKVYTSTEGAEETQLTISQADYYQMIDNATALYERAQELPGEEKELVENINQLYQNLIRFDAIEITSLFERLHSSASQLAKELEKSVMFSIAPNPIIAHLPHRLFDSLWNALYQILKNAIDHGVESEAYREQKGKPSSAEITFSVETHKENLILRLHDDGKGIDKEAILKTALQKKLISNQESKALKSAPSEKVFKLLFSPGFSTQSEVTTISGRGVGTDVIRQEIEAYQGIVLISSKIGKWTEFTLSIPIHSNHIIIEEPA